MGWTGMRRHEDEGGLSYRGDFGGFRLNLGRLFVLGVSTQAHLSAGEGYLFCRERSAYSSIAGLLND